MRPHRFDPISFVFGLILTALAVVGLTDLVGLRFMDVRWIGPAVLVLLGLVLVLSASRRRDGEIAEPRPEFDDNHIDDRDTAAVGAHGSAEVDAADVTDEVPDGRE